MSSKTDLRAYFKRRATGSDGPAAKKKNPNPEIIASATEHVNRAETEVVMDDVEKQIDQIFCLTILLVRVLQALSIQEGL